MKKIILIIAVLIQGFLANAQSIGYLDLPVVGELWIEFKDTIGTNFTISPSGAGQVWDYLNSFNVHDTITFLPQNTSTVPSSIDTLFPQANLVDESEIAGDYTFLKTDFTGLYVNGYHSDNGIDVAGFILNDINYTNDLLLIPIPFQFGDVIQNNAAYEYVYPDNTVYPGALVKVTYSTFQDLETESQGELTTPLGTYASTIRIKEMITKNKLFEVDSFAVGNFSYFTDFSSPTTVNYKWLKNGPNCLIMTAELDEFNNVISASYYTSSGLVADNNKTKSGAISMMPNPVSKGGSITIRLNDFDANSLIVCDLSGRTLFQSQVDKGSSKINLNTQNFESGLYYVKVLSNNQEQSVGKFIVAD